MAGITGNIFYNGMRYGGSLDLVAQTHLMRFLLLTVFNCLTAYFLLISRRDLRVNPGGVLEVVLPIVSIFWFLLYSFTEFIPDAVNPLCLAQEWDHGLAVAGAMLMLVGNGIVTCGVINLGRSFGIVVKVNTIQTTGLYKIVRHPIISVTFL